MKPLLRFELRNYFTKPGFYILIVLLLLGGVFTGSNFSMSVSPDVFKNSAYTIAYMIGLMSLMCIFFSTILCTQILFKETESNFNLILYATPLRKQDYLLSRFIAIFLISFLCFAFFTLGFATGQQLPKDRNHYTGFHWCFYLQPLLVFGLINTFFCTAILCSVGWLSKNKLMVYVSGLFIYIFYMVTLIFSRSPMIANSSTQSSTALQLSASLDPFGLSAYFLQTSNWSVPQRNNALVSLTGNMLVNRVGVVVVAFISLFISYRRFSFSVNEERKKKTAPGLLQERKSNEIDFKTVQPTDGWLSRRSTLLSFIKIDLKYIIKGIPFILTGIGLLFCLAMEMYGAIEQGIRIPEKYVSSGLMATTIIKVFPVFGLIIILYYANEIVWRSRNSNFHLIEKATPASATTLFFSKWCTLSIVIIFFSTLMILLGIAFQFFYQYTIINWQAYAGVYLFNSMPLIISAGIILCIQQLVNNKYAGLIISSAIVAFTATSLSKAIIRYPLLRFQNPYNGLYSDMNGYGIYTSAFAWRMIFGVCIVMVCCILITQFRKLRMRPLPLLIAAVLIVVCYISAQKILNGYQPKDEAKELAVLVDYEKKYRHFQNEPQPTVTDIITTIDLFPSKNGYSVAATYTIKNKTNKPVNSILINLKNGIKLSEAKLHFGNSILQINDKYSVVSLPAALLPGDTAQFTCRFSYIWAAVNGHESFNAIVQNGSFMRISRYYPQIGYLTENEIEDEREREKFKLGKATALKTIDASRDAIDDFINLKMTISTDEKQTAIGVGELVNKWKAGDRNYFQYQTRSSIPFRFAVSSAEYAIATATQNGKNIEVYYHPSHKENVQHLIKNAQLTIQYCEENFGAYPFKTIRFAEVSSFTKGFAATAYPATIFMAEDMIFHANINADKKQDVINELAGHELAHIWWGNSQIAPDEREGAAMLTETLAMYTELMLVKKMYGDKRVMENVNMHLGIYLNERGFADEQPLYKVLPGSTHVSYSKGLVTMYQLGEMIGEEKINIALQQLLKHHAYPNGRAVATDFINELYAVTDSTLHSAIDDLFKKIMLYDFNIRNSAVKIIDRQYELTLNAVADKYYEDGKANKTKASFNDSVKVLISFKNGKEQRWFLPIKGNKISGKILLDDRPAAIAIDPGIKFTGAGERKINL